ncbi:MAG: hypothetical protein Ct9H300mP1_26840 [Planctomycetaceae bacterium]|nr:MAG: hypothetical protein Ct9H300mP1_26840 [Planctomycetaceae bacterium]
MIFGGLATIERYVGNPRVSAHGPGFSKIFLGDDKVDDWEKYIDLMADSVYINSGRSCISCSGIWASRHTAEIADALASGWAPWPHCRWTTPRGAGRVHDPRGRRSDERSDRRRMQIGCGDRSNRTRTAMATGWCRTNAVTS